MGLGLLRIQEDSSAFNGLMMRRMLVASIASFIWYSNAHRFYITPRQTTFSLPAVFCLSYILSRGFIMQFQAFDYKMNEIEKKKSQFHSEYMSKRNTKE